MILPITNKPIYVISDAGFDPSDHFMIILDKHWPGITVDDICFVEAHATGLKETGRIIVVENKPHSENCVAINPDTIEKLGLNKPIPIINSHVFDELVQVVRDPDPIPRKSVFHPKNQDKLRQRFANRR